MDLERGLAGNGALTLRHLGHRVIELCLENGCFARNPRKADVWHSCISDFRVFHPGRVLVAPPPMLWRRWWQAWAAPLSLS